MKANQPDGFAINKVELTENGFTYTTFRLTGRVDGQRIRKQFKSEAEAKGELARLEIQAANADGQIRAVLTRLSDREIKDAEHAKALLGDVPLSVAASYLWVTITPSGSHVEEFGGGFRVDRGAPLTAVAMHRRLDCLTGVADRHVSEAGMRHGTARAGEILRDRPGPLSVEPRVVRSPDG